MNFSPGFMLISDEKKGSELVLKQSFPLRSGRYYEIRSRDFEFCFNLNGEIKTIRGLTPDWPHPAEQFKRTIGNDWVYYTVGDDSSDEGLVSWMGEYHMPCLPYASNPVWETDHFSNPRVMNAIAQWSQLFANLYMANEKGLYARSRAVIKKILAHDDQVLYKRALALHSIIGGRVSVLPPDTRHVDYDVIPLTIADGCLYKCNFCCVKSELSFNKRDGKDIQTQLERLKLWFGDDAANYHGLFLGSHDALAAGHELICFAADQAFSAFGFRQRMEQDPYLFLFASVGSFLKSDRSVFEVLNQLGFYVYINIGFESMDPDTLTMIGKPLTPGQVQEGLEKMVEINAVFDQVEVTGNFLIGSSLSEDHAHLLVSQMEDLKPDPGSKGAIYLSPLKDSPKKRELLPLFRTIKEKSRLPVYIYLIQRL